MTAAMMESGIETPSVDFDSLLEGIVRSAAPANRETEEPYVIGESGLHDSKGHFARFYTSDYAKEHGIKPSPDAFRFLPSDSLRTVVQGYVALLALAEIPVRKEPAHTAEQEGIAVIRYPITRPDTIKDLFTGFTANYGAVRLPIEDAA